MVQSSLQLVSQWRLYTAQHGHKLLQSLAYVSDFFAIAVTRLEKISDCTVG
jgi:hypothetical protein